MIKIAEKSGLRVRDPDHLIPILFRCSKCGCTIRKIESTNSYVLMSLSPAIEKGTQKICPHCYRLKEYKGISS